MIHEIFNFHYTTHMHPLRLTPLTHDELSRGMPEDAINKYLSLVKDLYDACFFDVNAPFTPPTREEKHQRHLKQETIYNALIKHLFMFDTISDAVYSELYEGMVTNFDLLERPDSPDRYVSDSFDDFRLAFERNLVESDQCIDMRFEYLADRYGFGFGTHSAEDALMIFRIQDAAEQSLCEISCWEVRHLLSRIQKDISRNSEEQRRLDADFCHPKHPHFVTAPQTYATPKTIHEWYTIKRALEVEAGYLLQVEELVKDVFTSMDAPDKAAGSEMFSQAWMPPIKPQALICHYTFTRGRLFVIRGSTR